MFAMGGCGPLTTYYKPGVSVAQLERDQTRCQVQALAQVPASTQVYHHPPERLPDRRICDADGNCRIKPGRIVPGRIETFDPNDGLRARVARQCMAERGYSRESIPLCSQAQRTSPVGAATTRLPKLTPNACYRRLESGKVQIVTGG
jgi:ferredoxin